MPPAKKAKKAKNPVKKTKKKMKVEFENPIEKIQLTKATLEDIGKQAKTFLKDLEAYIEDYKLSVVSGKGGVSVEFYLKARFKV